MRLNVKQLRIANLLLHNGVIKEISSLHSDNTLRFKEGKNTIGCFKATIEAIKPIPLTEEILLKCGYKLVRENHYGVLGHLIWNIENRFYCDKNGVQIKYVHQLQNLYFALTNEELIINLK